MPPTPAEIQTLVSAITAADKYASIHPGLVRRLVISELNKGRSSKEAVKAVRSKLHQIGGAYQETSIGYAQAANDLLALPAELQAPALQDFCRGMLSMHASTNERLPLLDTFYQILAPIAPIQSVLDLACGLNPLARPWMPLAPDAPYYAYDIYADMLDFINTYFKHIQQPGSAALCDLTTETPQQPVHLALLLKTIPCLEQVDKNIGNRLLFSIQADYLLVTFPARSLGGHEKGMVNTYETHFNDLLTTAPWQLLQRTLYQNELAFLLKHA